ncbi:DUF2513 domain-containing protein [Virgibacillus salarius]|uniref:DUF2513 domain-containing protein n=1 Tax=Virgibacillus TaxID=84406 RepID=UPI002A90CAF7|nr:DUF2513 domain-containing protein [Virgibacillus sp. M23]MDY7044067.1 DUF2513 domain-containing protein [Virgibacillus sp. M23]
MKLNQDCVRSILLELEEQLTLNETLVLQDLKDFETFNKFGYQTSVYALLKLKEADFIDGQVLRSDEEIIDIGIISITWSGHLFLDNIRDKVVWTKAKDSVKSLSSVSLSILSNVATSIVKNQIGLK